MKRRVFIAAAVFALVLSSAAVLYPLVSDSIADRQTDAIVVGVTANAAKAPAAKLAAEKRAAEAYNAALLPTAAAAPTSERYDKLLNLRGDGIMGVLSIPCIDMTLPMYHGTDDATLNRGAGHIRGTSLPVGGKDTHAVISAHSGLTGRRMFTDLDKLTIGDGFSIYVLGERLYYRVDLIKTVLPDDTSDLAISADKDYVTLVTCTPYGINSHRLLVRGVRALPDEKRSSPPRRQTEKGSTEAEYGTRPAYSGEVLTKSADHEQDWLFEGTTAKLEEYAEKNPSKAERADGDFVR